MLIFRCAQCFQQFPDGIFFEVDIENKHLIISGDQETKIDEIPLVYVGSKHVILNK